MKRILSFALLLCSLAVLNAQTQVGFVYDNHTYQNGDTMVVVLQKSAINCEGIAFKNQTASMLSNMVVTMTEIERDGFEAWGMCTDACVMGLTSNPFNLPPNALYNSFSIDLTIDANVECPYGVYNLQVSNGTITCAVVVRFQAYTLGIDDVLANSRLSAYPNPAEGQFRVSYEVSQPATLAIYDVQGRVVRQMPVCGNGTVMVSDLPAGIYAYGIVENGRRSQMQKLIVK